MAINAGTREHGVRYNQFIYCLNRSNIQLDRNMLSDLAKNEPYSFKAVMDEVVTQVDPAILKEEKAEMTYQEAMDQGYIGWKVVPEDEMPKRPVLKWWGLRYPERDAGTDADYLRFSFREEDLEWEK